MVLAIAATAPGLARSDEDRRRAGHARSAGRRPAALRPAAYTAVVAALARQTYATLFARPEGVMVGDGEIWFSGICADETCAEVTVRIIAINEPDGPGGPDGTHPETGRSWAPMRAACWTISARGASATDPEADPGC
jgi:hypothetical protein